MAIPVDVYLISVSYRVDGLMQRIPVETKRKVIGLVGSISASEFFEAGRSGLKPQCRVSLFAPDYNGEVAVELDGTRYGVYRTYTPKDDTIELYLERKAGV